jgi:hypothetical protein
LAARKTSIIERREDEEREYQTRPWAARGERYFDKLGRVKSESHGALNQLAVHKKYQLECQLESAAPGLPEAAGDGAGDRDFRANSAILKAER